MLYVYTLFDSRRDSRPLLTGVINTTFKSAKFYPLYLRGTGLTLYEIEQSLLEVKTIIASNPAVVLNDYKQHILGFDLQDHPQSVYDLDLTPLHPGHDLAACRKTISTVMAKMMRVEPQLWQSVRAKAAVVYAHLQKRGVRCGGSEVVFPTWGWVYSGRSRTTGVPIQGMGKGYLANVNNDPYYLHFDWVAADMRAATLMSKDPKLQASFVESDPYQYMVDRFNQTIYKWNRDEGKRALLSSIYKLDEDDNIALKFYSGFGKWRKECREKVQATGCLSSVMGRRFKVGGDRDIKSVFNATIQGSVAHGMQVCLRRVWDLYPDSILMESHDSLIVTAQKSEVRAKILNIANIMVQPFRGILDDNPQFPLVVSIGRGFKDWKEHCRFNSVADVKQREKISERAKEKEEEST